MAEKFATRAELITHLHEIHGGYPLGHDFVLVSTWNIEREHERKHQATTEPLLSVTDTQEPS